MALVTFLALWPLVHFVPTAVARWIGLPPILLEVASLGLIVLLMTYVVMPAVTRVLSPLVYPR